MATGGVVAVMREAHGTDLSRYDETFLNASVGRRREAVSLATSDAYLEHLRGSRGEAAALLQALRVGYSEFFRDALAFALLEREFLPALAAARNCQGGRELRVWSAGCAGGQEAWSAAIMLDELAATTRLIVPYRVIATDICAEHLSLARDAAYSADALGNVHLRRLRTYFEQRGESFVVMRRLRERVDFSVHDLLDEGTTCPPASIFGDFDLVLCCNVLLYHRPEAQRLILRKLRRTLAPRGCLVTGDAERMIVERAGGFRALAPPAAVFAATLRGK